MRSDRPRAVLLDIKRNIELAKAFISGMSLATFRTDQKTVYAVIRCLEIISEASKRLPAELKDRHPGIPWVQIASAGNVYRHGYQLVRDDFVWSTVSDELEPLRAVVDQELARLVGE